MALKLVLFSIIRLFFFQYAGGSQTFRLGTKTAYHFNNSASSITHPDRCEPIHLNMVIRHGSRLPSDGDMEEIDALLTKLNQIYTKDSPFRYQNLTLPWIKPPLWNDGNPGELTAVGEIEQYSIAKRFRAVLTESSTRNTGINITVLCLQINLARLKAPWRLPTDYLNPKVL